MNALRLPIWGGWALSQEAAEYVSSELRINKPKLIAETGSGPSTLLLNQYAPTYSFEHEKKYHHKTKQLLKNYGCKGNIVLADIVQTEDGWWYDTEIPDNIDFLLIDGPQGYYGRGGILYQFAPHLSNGAVVLLDDANRNKEKDILELWKRYLGVEYTYEHERVAKIIWRT